MTLEIAVEPSSYHPTSGKISFSWVVPTRHDVGLLKNRFDVQFTPAPFVLTRVEIFDMFCGCLLPHFALKSSRLVISGLPAVETDVHKFWSNYLRLLGISCDVEFTPETGNSAPPAERPEALSSQPGLYFGGGVESLSLLSLIKHVKPMLLTVDGTAWMNSDYSKSTIKSRLQDQLARRYDLEFLRVWTDIRTLFPDGDTYINRYLTGTLMHYLLVPALRHKGIATTYIATELEYSLYDLPFDHSMHPRFIHNVVRHPNPAILSPLNAIPKIELLDSLHHRDPELCSYLYSCLFNTDRRWCGDCGKCRRISAFCHAIGIPKASIGMQDGIKKQPETGRGTTDRYWKAMEQYSNKRRAETRSLFHDDSLFSRLTRRLRLFSKPTSRV